MQKSTVSLIITFVICATVLGLGGEYFSYQYYSSIRQQASSADTGMVSGSNTTTATINQTGTGSSENAITSFDIEDPLAVGTIDQSVHTVTLTLPPDTDVTKLAPSIELSDNATVSPASGSPEDFTNPVTYTVTAQNGATQQYMVTVNVISSIQTVQKLITSFEVAGVNGVISNNNNTVMVIVPDGTDLTKLTPTIQVSDGATISPASGVVQDFTNPVTYTVTDLYGTTQNYTVSVVTESNSG